MFAQLKEEVIAYSKTIGIEKIGFTTAEPFIELKNRLQTQQQLNYQSGFEEPDLDRRTNPRLLLDKANSIISIALAYPSKLKDAPISKKDNRRGIFCKASWGTDYHHLVKEKLMLIESFLASKLEDVKCKYMVDTGELSDRAVAERSGIGWSAKNCSIITPEFGSYVYLGEIITNIPFPPDKPIEDQCGSCTKCLDACPTGALIQGGQIDAKKCIAYLTQTKDIIPDEYREKIGNRLYGCDTCQQVCPKNKGIDFHLHPEMEPDPEVVKPKLIPILTLSNREFKDRFGELSGSWRGKKPIQRNAIIALAHFKDETAIPVLIGLVKNDQRKEIRGTAAWALGKIGGEQAMKALQKFKQSETDAIVYNEIEKGLSLITKEY